MNEPDTAVPESSNDAFVLVCAQCGKAFPSDGKFCPFDGAPLRRKVASVRDPLLGHVIDSRYHVLSVLGQGGTGTVFAVRHTLLGKQFALKVLRHEFARDGEAAGRFVREAQAIARVKHPSVCEISDFGQLPDGRPYFVMELLQGHSLAWWLGHGGAPPIQAAVAIADKVAAALAAAHQTGVVHRDLKPANIIVDDALNPGHVKVVDFGLAHVAGQVRMTQPGMACGTPYYVSPEQAAGLEVDQRSDLYSLGVVLYELLTGCVPFEADSYVGVLTQHMHVAPLPPSQVAGAPDLGALEEVVLRALSKSPERRHQSAGAFAEALRAALGEDAQGRPSVMPRRVTGFRAPPLCEVLEPPLRHATPAPGEYPTFRRGPGAWGWIAAAAVVGVVGALVYQQAQSPPAAAATPDARPTTSMDVLAPAPLQVAETTSDAPAQRAPVGITEASVVTKAPDIRPAARAPKPSVRVPAATAPPPVRATSSAPIAPRVKGAPSPSAEAQAQEAAKPLPTVSGGIVDPWATERD